MIVAKKTSDRFQSLREHTDWVVKEVMEFIDEKSVCTVARKLGWQTQKVIDLLFFSAYFHDIGKATKEFQKTITEGAKSYHPLYSASVLVGIEDFDFEEDEIYVNLLLISVLTHHTLFPYKVMHQNFTFLQDAEEFFKEYKNSYERWRKRKCRYEWRFEKYEDMEREIGYIRTDLEMVRSRSILQMVYSYISGTLSLADWLASARLEDSGYKLRFDDISAEDVKHHLPFELKDFQRKLYTHQGSVLVEIPTGEGKTEGSLLWAMTNLNDTNSKIIYTMPTQTTSNKLYDRFTKLFGQKVCGLIHSNASSYLEKLFERENGVVDEEFKNEFLYIKHFCKPVTVSTIDALLKHFVNAGRFNIVLRNFLNSVVIIDEVHSYDFRLLGFIKRFLEICKEYNVPVCLMSASLPKKIKELLHIEHYPLITQRELFEKRAIDIKKRDVYLEEEIEAIVAAYQKGKKVLVIRNLIADAKETFRVLRDSVENILLYHSEFRKIDRIAKEQLIFEKLRNEEPFVLVATQVVEISLDIDFDTMFTDNAPIDSLIQRFGRVNRKKDPKKIADVYIYKTKNAKPYGNDYLLKLTFDIIEEGCMPIKKYQYWLDGVYDRLFKEDIQIQNEIAQKFEQGYRLYEEKLRANNAIEKNYEEYELRDIDYPKFEYILYEDYMEGRLSFEYTISLPIYYEKGHIYKPQEELPYKVLQLPYSFEIGVDLQIGQDNPLW